MTLKRFRENEVDPADFPKVKDLGSRDIGTDYGKLKQLAQTNIEKLQKALTDFESRMMQTNNVILSQIGRVGTGYAQDKADINRLSGEVEVLKNQYEKVQSESQEMITDLRNQLSAKDEEINKLKGDMVQAVGEKGEALKSLEARLQEMQNAADEYVKELDKSKGLIQDLETKLGTAQSNVGAETQLVDDLSKAYEQETETLKRANTEMTQQYQELAVQYNRLLKSIRTGTKVSDMETVADSNMNRRIANMQAWGSIDLNEHLERMYRNQPKK